MKGDRSMRFTRWQPFQSGAVLDQLQQFQREMNRLFDRWGDGNRPFGVPGGYPAVNMWEDNDNVFVQAELPGLDLKDLEIYVTGGNRLTLKGQRKPAAPEKGVWHRQERAFGEFERVLSLPFVVNPDNVEARFENGVLQVKLAKHESAKPRKINVKGE
jgi:HSP20 family protein